MSTHTHISASMFKPTPCSEAATERIRPAHVTKNDQVKGLSLVLTLSRDAHCSVELVASARFHHLPNTQRMCKCRTRGNLLARRLRQNVGVVETRPRRHGVSRKTFAQLLQQRDGVFRAIADVLKMKTATGTFKEYWLEEVFGHCYY